VPPRERVYQKDEFFDCLSCEALERTMGGGECSWRSTDCTLNALLSALLSAPKYSQEQFYFVEGLAGGGVWWVAWAWSRKYVYIVSTLREGAMY
jgi:hypothetical protein